MEYLAAYHPVTAAFTMRMRIALAITWLITLAIMMVNLWEVQKPCHQRPHPLAPGEPDAFFVKREPVEEYGKKDCICDSSPNAEISMTPAPRIEPKIEYKVPNIVHFIWYSYTTKPLEFHQMLSVMSAQSVLKPDIIYFHTNLQPVGKYWLRVKQIPSLRINYRKPPEKLYGERLKDPVFYTSHSNVDRLLVLAEFGGIYLDLDVLITKPFDDLRLKDCTIGLENPALACNSVIVCTKDSPFLKLWINSYLDDYQVEEWSYNSAKVPFKLAQRFPSLVYLDESKINRPSSRELSKIWGSEKFDWRSNYAVHIWFRIWKTMSPFYTGEDPNEDNVRGMDSTFGEIARTLLYGDPGIIDEDAVTRNTLPPTPLIRLDSVQEIKENPLQQEMDVLKETRLALNKGNVHLVTNRPQHIDENVLEDEEDDTEDDGEDEQDTEWYDNDDGEDNDEEEVEGEEEEEEEEDREEDLAENIDHEQQEKVLKGAVNEGFMPAPVQEAAAASHIYQGQPLNVVQNINPALDKEGDYGAGQWEDDDGEFDGSDENLNVPQQPQGLPQGGMIGNVPAQIHHVPAAPQQEYQKAADLHQQPGPVNQRDTPQPVLTQGTAGMLGIQSQEPFVQQVGKQNPQVSPILGRDDDSLPPPRLVDQPETNQQVVQPAPLNGPAAIDIHEQKAPVDSQQSVNQPDYGNMQIEPPNLEPSKDSEKLGNVQASLEHHPDKSFWIERPHDHNAALIQQNADKENAKNSELQRQAPVQNQGPIQTQDLVQPVNQLQRLGLVQHSDDQLSQQVNVQQSGQIQEQLPQQKIHDTMQEKELEQLPHLEDLDNKQPHQPDQEMNDNALPPLDHRFKPLQPQGDVQQPEAGLFRPDFGRLQPQVVEQRGEAEDTAHTPYIARFAKPNVQPNVIDRRSAITDEGYGKTQKASLQSPRFEGLKQNLRHLLPAPTSRVLGNINPYAQSYREQLLSRFKPPLPKLKLSPQLSEKQVVPVNRVPDLNQPMIEPAIEMPAPHPAVPPERSSVLDNADAAAAALINYPQHRIQQNKQESLQEYQLPARNFGFDNPVLGRSRKNMFLHSDEANRQYMEMTDKIAPDFVAENANVRIDETVNRVESNELARESDVLNVNGNSQMNFGQVANTSTKDEVHSEAKQMLLFHASEEENNQRDEMIGNSVEIGVDKKNDDQIIETENIGDARKIKGDTEAKDGSQANVEQKDNSDITLKALSEDEKFAREAVGWVNVGEGNER